jgi:hypothetical protein
VIEFSDQFDLKLGPYLSLGWPAPDDSIQQAAETAKQAEGAVMLVGYQFPLGIFSM